MTKKFSVLNSFERVNNATSVLETVIQTMASLFDSYQVLSRITACFDSA